MAIWVEAKIEELILASQRGSGLVNSIVVEVILVRWLDRRNRCHQQSNSYNLDNVLLLHTANEIWMELFRLICLLASGEPIKAESRIRS